MSTQANHAAEERNKRTHEGRCLCWLLKGVVQLSFELEQTCFKIRNIVV